MHMYMMLIYKGKIIISYAGGKRWWCTGFNPNHLKADPKKLTAVFTVQFLNLKMYNAFRDRYDGNPYWTFFPEWHSAGLIF
ncbi:hypothetical protein SDC9_184172 [bioreactor metagenome]|uniref:Uncharacterized protein n=1 Tax=bioreactor metagenome TaxID=1076179 RepID=A0A645HE71_9ZZZZ